MEIAALAIEGARVGNEVLRGAIGLGIDDMGKKVITKFFRGVRKIGHKAKEQFITQGSPQKIKDDMHTLLRSSESTVATSSTKLSSTSSTKLSSTSSTKLSSTSSINSSFNSDDANALCLLLLLHLMSRESRITEVVSQKLNSLAVKPTRYEVEEHVNRLNFLDYYCHIAVAGCSGTGKSSFINAIRGLKDNEPGAAPVGWVETTVEMKQYLPGWTEGKVIWYDVPGAGTMNIPREDYFRRQGLFVMDAIIVLWSDRLMDTDIDIMKQCASCNIPCFLLRSKCDNSIKDIEDDLCEEMPRDAALRSKAYRQELNRRIREFERKTMKVAVSAMRDAFKYESGYMDRDYTSSIFLVNSKSIYKMIADCYLDTFVLDEKRFLMQVSNDLAEIGKRRHR